LPSRFSSRWFLRGSVTLSVRVLPATRLKEAEPKVTFRFAAAIVYKWSRLGESASYGSCASH
jgi:hypothetical protein